MMSCKQMTDLISQSLDRELGPSERVSMKFHLLFCTGCTNFRDNMNFLHQACRGLATDAASQEP